MEDKGIEIGRLRVGGKGAPRSLLLILQPHVDAARILPTGILESIKDGIHACAGRIENNHFSGQEIAGDKPVHYFLRNRRCHNAVPFDAPHIHRYSQAWYIFRRVNNTGAEVPIVLRCQVRIARGEDNCFRLGVAHEGSR